MTGAPKSDKDAFQKTKTKLEKLLAMPDVFDALRCVNAGIVRSYDDLDKQTRGHSESNTIQSDVYRPGSVLTTTQNFNQA